MRSRGRSRRWWRGKSTEESWEAGLRWKGLAGQHKQQLCYCKARTEALEDCPDYSICVPICVRCKMRLLLDDDAHARLFDNLDPLFRFFLIWPFFFELHNTSETVTTHAHSSLWIEANPTPRSIFEDCAGKSSRLTKLPQAPRCRRELFSKYESDFGGKYGFLKFLYLHILRNNLNVKATYHVELWKWQPLWKLMQNHDKKGVWIFLKKYTCRRYDGT
jgi:hypothetical protein